MQYPHRSRQIRAFHLRTAASSQNSSQATLYRDNDDSIMSNPSSEPDTMDTISDFSDDTAPTNMRSRLRSWAASVRVSMLRRRESYLDSYVCRGLSPWHKDCKKLELYNWRLRLQFYALVAACCLVLSLQILVIVFLCSVLPELTQESRSGNSPSASFQKAGSGNGCHKGDLFCVAYDNVLELRDVWNPVEQREVRALTMPVGHCYVKGHGSGKDNKQFCYPDPKWILNVLVKVTTVTYGSLTIIEKVIKEINETLTASSQECEKGDVTDSDKAFFVQQYITSPGNHTGNLSSHFITIKHPGLYFVYSRVVFKDNSSGAVHSVNVTRGDITFSLMESSSTESSLEGVFMMKQNDILFVYISNPSIEKKPSNYIGAYLIRTS